MGCSTFWLAGAAGALSTVVGIDGGAGNVELARSACRHLGLEDRTDFVVGQVAEVLPTLREPFDAGGGSGTRQVHLELRQDEGAGVFVNRVVDR